MWKIEGISIQALTIPEEKACLSGERIGEQLDGRVVQIVECCNHSEVHRHQVTVVFDGNAFGLLQISQRGFDQL